MMKKFRSPFNTNELFITQTYHGENKNNPDDLSLQCAIDLSARGATNVYSVCDGVVDGVTGSYGSYVSIIPDNANFRILYVHVDRFQVNKGDRVRKGQLIAKIRSLQSGSHLHFGLKRLDGRTPHPCPMDYFDRTLFFNTRYSAIKNIWFKNGTLDWSKFKDLSYDNTAMFKVGDNIIFTGEQNVRKGSGLKYKITGKTKKGMKSKIEGGPRNVDNYVWYDLEGADWVADVGKFRKYTPNPEDNSNESECKKELSDLKIYTQALESQTGTQEAQLEVMGDEIDTLQLALNKKTANLELCKSDLEELFQKYEALEEDFQRVEKERNEAINKLNNCEFCGASTSELFAEIWKRIIRFIK